MDSMQSNLPHREMARNNFGINTDGILTKKTTTNYLLNGGGEQDRAISVPTSVVQHNEINPSEAAKTVTELSFSGNKSPSTLTQARMMKRCSKQQLLSKLPKKPFLRIQYASHCCSGKISESVKNEILSVAQRENEIRGITGVLICVNDMFFQIIEGHTQHVETLYHNILKDKRHYDVVCVDKMYFDSESERYFPDWCMQSLDMESLFDHCLDPSLSTAVGAAFRAFKTLLVSLLNTQQVFRNYAQPVISKYLSEGENPMIKESIETDKVILFIDLVNYTSITEKLSKTRKPSQVVEILNKFFGCVMEIVEDYCGEITKLIGDCVMVYFDGSECQEAVNCSIEILERLEILRQTSEDPFVKMIYCTIGISRGSVIFGNVGSVGRKLDFTLIGDSVNIASRLQSFASISPYFLIFDESVKGRLDKDSCDIIEVGPIELKGKEKTVNTYTVEHELNRKPPKKEMDRIMSLASLSEYC
uniref:Photoactivated adenylyl cyclase n=1 Tax=Naegleria australiensis TaxID=51634 RepID=W0SQL6_9EUKA|nr:photoactivated adenylyl cyclase [Naegleria australiensis]